jgi:hypothetical protein
MIKIWSMRKEAAEADKRKPKQKAAEIRVQKGKYLLLLYILYICLLSSYRYGRIGCVAEYYVITFPRSK